MDKNPNSHLLAIFRKLPDIVWNVSFTSFIIVIIAFIIIIEKGEEKR